MLSYVIDGLFVADIVIQFRTTYVNSMTGDEIWQPSMIARHYGFSVRIWLDVISSVPFQAFTMVN